MPQVFKIAGYTVYFWVNENNPLEPVHVHIAKGVPSPKCYQNMDYKVRKMSFVPQ
mgnify:CR=1 FL=1